MLHVPHVPLAVSAMNVENVASIYSASKLCPREYNNNDTVLTPPQKSN